MAEGDQVAMSLNTARQKVKNLETEPACTCCSSTCRTLPLPGDPGHGRRRARRGHSFADKVGAKYGSDLREHDAPGDRRVIVRVVPLHVNAVNMRG